MWSMTDLMSITPIQPQPLATSPAREGQGTRRTHTGPKAPQKEYSLKRRALEAESQKHCPKSTGPELPRKHGSRTASWHPPSHILPQAWQTHHGRRGEAACYALPLHGQLHACGGRAACKLDQGHALEVAGGGLGARKLRGKALGAGDALRRGDSRQEKMGTRTLRQRWAHKHMQNRVTHTSALGAGATLRAGTAGRRAWAHTHTHAHAHTARAPHQGRM